MASSEGPTLLSSSKSLASYYYGSILNVPWTNIANSFKSNSYYFYYDEDDYWLAFFST